VKKASEDLLAKTEGKRKKSEDAVKKALEKAKHQAEEAERRAVAATAAAAAGKEATLTFPSHWTKAKAGDEDERHLVPVQVSKRFYVTAVFL
jgi:hypothetical protein